ncbi:DUF488 domain-containing protein [Bacillus niameyensis]|uniref:DUF488 domain-containing protein n=1 Tax=Bacillus niameyensis TaxID=1522308 RepID=UPI000784F581|nr:DUF488 domain-containing protein [Bacillus niameyensis]
MRDIIVKRIYEPYNQNDGTRVLVDRVWPRGIKKEDAKLDTWLKSIAPSTELRKWFGHKPERFAEFKAKYIEEMKNDNKKRQEFEKLCELAKENKITLLFAAKDEKYNNAVVLKEKLLEQLGK